LCDFLYVVNLYNCIACYQVSSGVIAIFGPQDEKLGLHIGCLCAALDIPHIEARLQNIAINNAKEFSINLHPGADAISQSLRSLVSFLNWTKVAVIYEDDLCMS
jgi:ionotropic kainate glutamate receptor 2